MNVRKLKSFMALNGDSQKKLSIALGMAPQTLAYKIKETNGREFKQSEILFIKNRYSLKAKEINDIFFDDIVS